MVRKFVSPELFIIEQLNGRSIVGIVTVKRIFNYHDEFNNIISYDGVYRCGEADISFYGRNNKLVVSNNAEIKKLSLEFRGSNASVIIGASSSRIRALVGDNCKISIDDGLSTTGIVYMTAFDDSGIEIGRDCMLAGGVQIRADDAHAIFDVNTGKRINKSKQIIIGNHVWIGEGSILLNGAAIGSGSVIGIRSIVKATFPNNCIIAGVPARILRKDIAWERPHLNQKNLFNKDGTLIDGYCVKEFWDITRE